jgi:hypothetical protein
MDEVVIFDIQLLAMPPLTLDFLSTKIAHGDANKSRLVSLGPPQSPPAFNDTLDF